MTLYERYINGETSTVYEEIEQLGQTAFNSDNFGDVEKVLVETFTRVRYNLEIIHKELKEINYNFKADFESNSNKPLSSHYPTLINY